MNKKEKIKEILEQLFLKTKKNGNFSRHEIESAISTSLYILDQRTIDNWFKLLWKLDVFTQPKHDNYCLNWERLVELEVSTPVELDPKQRRLL